MEKLPYGNSKPKSKFFVPPLWRRRRTAVLTFFALSLCAGYLVFNHWDTILGRHDPHSEDQHLSANVTPQNELQNLIYFTSRYPALHLPVQSFEETLTPHVMAKAVGLTAREWVKRVDEAERAEPLVVFSKTYCPYSRRAKELLSNYKLSPAPRIIEADEHEDNMLIKMLLLRLTKRGTFPNAILQLKPIGGSDDLLRLHDEGLLEGILGDAGIRSVKA